MSFADHSIPRSELFMPAASVRLLDLRLVVNIHKGILD